MLVDTACQMIYDINHFIFFYCHVALHSSNYEQQHNFLKKRMLVYMYSIGSTTV